MNYSELYNELSAAPHYSKGQVINKWAEMLNCSTDTLYRQMRKLYGKQKQVKRRTKVDPENRLIRMIAEMKTYGCQGLSGRELSTELCIEILTDRGEPDAALLLPGTVNRRLNEMGYRDIEPIVRVEAEYSNQQHQMDFSRSKLFQIYKYDEGKGDYLLRATSKQLIYKEDNASLRSWLVNYIDAYSRIFLVQMYPAAGESVMTGIEFLTFIYNRQDSTHPLYCLPETLKTDNGAFIKNLHVQQLIKDLEIKAERSTPMKKRGIQKAESVWRTVWNRFETRLYVKLKEGATIHINDYNAELYNWCVEMLEWHHPVKKETRLHVYNASLTAHPPRVLEAEVKDVIRKPFERTVAQDLTVDISSRGEQIKLAVSNYKLIGKRIRVFVNMNGEAVGQVIDEPGSLFTLTATEGYVKLGDFTHRHKPTFRQEVERGIAGPVQQRQSKIKYIAPREDKFTPDTPFTQAEETIFINEFEAKDYVARQFHDDYENYKEIFDPLFVDTLKKANIDEVIAGIKEKRIAL